MDEKVIYLRRRKSGSSFMAYASIAEAVDDRDGSTMGEVYAAPLKLLGTVQWTLVPVERGAVKVELKFGAPEDAK